MPALHIRTRNDLIKYVIDHAPYKAIERALLEGKVENFGAFAELYINSYPGWIIRVASRACKVWLLAIDQEGKINVIEEVVWGFWMGDMNPNRKLYAGDNPEQYRKERDNARDKSV